VFCTFILYIIPRLKFSHQNTAVLLSKFCRGFLVQWMRKIGNQSFENLQSVNKQLVVLIWSAIMELSLERLVYVIIRIVIITIIMSSVLMQHYNCNIFDHQSSSNLRLLLQICAPAGISLIWGSMQLPLGILWALELSSGAFMAHIDHCVEWRDSVLLWNACVVCVFSSGWCLVMHGGNGRFSWQVLSCSLWWRSANSRDCSEENHRWRKCR